MRALPILTGALGLAGLQLAVGSSSERVSGLLGGVATGVRWWLSPLVPAIPDRRKATTPAPASSSTSSSSAYPSPSQTSIGRP